MCPSRIKMPVEGALCSNKMIGVFPASVPDKLNNRNEILHLPSWASIFLVFFFSPLPSPVLIIFINGLTECIWDVHKPLTFECSVFPPSVLLLPVWFHRSFEDRERHKDRFRWQKARARQHVILLPVQMVSGIILWGKGNKWAKKARMELFWCNDLTESPISALERKKDKTTS